MVLSSKPVLSSIIQRVKLISPVASEVEPLGGSFGGDIGGSYCVILVVICISVCVQGGVPKRPSIGEVMEDAPR